MSDTGMITCYCYFCKIRLLICRQMSVRHEEAFVPTATWKPVSLRLNSGKRQQPPPDRRTAKQEHVPHPPRPSSAGDARRGPATGAAGALSSQRAIPKYPEAALKKAEQQRKQLRDRRGTHSERKRSLKSHKPDRQAHVWRRGILCSVG